MALGLPDAELRQVFAEEARERLESMSRLLLELETAEDRREVVAALFREAHTLKGSASMVGLGAIGRLGHAMEDLLSELREGTRALTPEVVDALLAASDALASVVEEALAGRPHEAEAEAAAAALRAAMAGEAPAPAAPAAPLPAAEPARAAPRQDRLAVPVARLDELVRLIGETVAGQLRLGALLRDALDRDPESLEEFRAFSHVLRELQEVAIRTRMVPIGQVVPGLRRAIRDAARITGKRVRLEVTGEETEVDRRVLDLLAEGLLHLVRNAVDHGVEPPEDRLRAGKPAEGVIRLDAAQRRTEAVIVLADDGRGIDLQRVREVVARGRGQPAADLPDADALQLIFRSGFSTASEVGELSGRGVGLDVVRDRLETIQGRLEVQSRPGEGTEFRITVPLTFAVVPSLLVAAGGQRFALPMHSIEAIVPPGSDERWAGGRPVVMVEERPVPVDQLAATLGLAAAGEATGPAVLLQGHAGEHGFRVDRVIGQRQVVVKSLSAILPRLPAVAGASAEPDGAVLLMLEATALIERARRGRPRPASERAEHVVPAHRPAAREPETVLVVDDSTIVREVERSILERAGYRVLLAGDGVEAIAVLAEQSCALVLTDVDMPRKDGFQLTAEIRATPRLAQLPVILLTSRADEESHRRGLEAGADAYVVKSSFDREAMLALVDRALGHR